MAKKSTKKELSWPEIGAAIASRVEKEAKNNPPKSWNWSWYSKSEKNGHFASALIFAITALWSLNALGYTKALPWWIEAILVLSFAFMFS